MRAHRMTLGIAATATAAAAAVAALTAVGHASPTASRTAGGTAQDTPRTAVATTAVCSGFTATNAAGQQKVITTNDATTYDATTWTPLACGAFSVTAPRGKRALVVVKVDGEVTCTGADGQWCQGRVLIGGVEGQPSAPEPDSFAWANSEVSAAQWESNAFTRTRLLACPTTHPWSSCSWAVRTQVRNHVAGLTLRVDDSTVHGIVTYF